MQSIKTMNDQQLHQTMVRTAQKERELTAEMISMIQEANRRKFYLDLKFGSLFEYLTEGLSYSGAAAQRRIAAARIADEVPEVKERVLDGSLTLSNLSQAEKFFRTESDNDHKLNQEDKKMVLKKLENKSTRDAERTLLELSTAPLKLQPEKTKAVTPEITQITINVTAEFMSQLEEARGLLAHTMPYATMAEVLAEMMKLGIAVAKKKKFKIPLSESLGKEIRQDTSAQAEARVGAGAGDQNQVETNSPLRDAPPTLNSASSAGAGSEVSQKSVSRVPTQRSKKNEVLASDSDYIPAAVMREVSKRDQGRCVVINPRTGKPCGSIFGLEFDHHPIPKAMGGPSTVQNLRVSCQLCRIRHNLHYADSRIMPTLVDLWLILFENPIEKSA